MEDALSNGSREETMAPKTLPSSASSSDDSGQCRLFLFVVDCLLTGGLCLFGFAGNTISFMTLWQEKLSSSSCLLEAIVVCDVAVLWTLFLGHCVPALGWAVDALRYCHRLCDYVSEVTRPLLQLAEVCAVWLSLVMLVKRYLVTCRYSPAVFRDNPAGARKYVAAVVLLATLFTVPLTVEKHVHVDVGSPTGNQTSARRLYDVFWYRLIYHDVVGTLMVYVTPLVLQLVLLVRLARAVQSTRQLRGSLAASYRPRSADITQLVLTLSVTMVICYTPLMIEKALLWIRGYPVPGCATLGFYLRSFARLFLALNSSLKIVLLSLFVGDFRPKMAELLTCRHANRRADGSSVEYNMYRCPDMSEMTLISNVDSRA